MRASPSPRRAACLAAALLGPALAGCRGTLNVTPASHGFAAADCVLPGRLEYTGSREYAPPVVVDTSAAPVVYAFAYDVTYGSTALAPLVQFVNPLNLVGFPTGGHDVHVLARVDVRAPGADVRHYAAAAVAGATGTMFSEGGTLTELRRRALLAARESLSRQLCTDAALLASLARVPAGAPPPP